MYFADNALEIKLKRSVISIIYKSLIQTAYSYIFYQNTAATIF